MAVHKLQIAEKIEKQGSTEGMVYLEGGSFLMGTDDATFPADGEGPVREVELSPFWIDPYAVTNEKFATFAEETGYVTEAERFGWSFVFYGFLPENLPPTRAVPEAPWWRKVFSACWKCPEGPEFSVQKRLNHLVIHVSWNDAVTYADWTGGTAPGITSSCDARVCCSSQCSPRGGVV